MSKGAKPEAAGWCRLLLLFKGEEEKVDVSVAVGRGAGETEEEIAVTSKSWTFKSLFSDSRLSTYSDACACCIRKAW